MIRYRTQQDLRQRYDSARDQQTGEVDLPINREDRPDYRPVLLNESSGVQQWVLAQSAPQPRDSEPPAGRAADTGPRPTGHRSGPVPRPNGSSSGPYASNQGQDLDAQGYPQTSKGRDWHAVLRIMIVDDQGLFREGLTQILTAETDFEVVAGTCQSDAVRAARREQPDVIVFANESAAGKITDQLNALLLVAPASKVVVLAMHDEPRRVRHLLAAGAHAYVLKSASPEELITTIRVVNEHTDRVMLSVSRQTLNTLRGNQGLLLSERELEVLTLVAEGKRNSDIAAQLFIAEGTVKRHLTNIYAKLGATSRTDAVRKAVTQGHGLYAVPCATAAETQHNG